MKFNLVATPPLLLCAVYLLSVLVASLAGFDLISVNTHFLILFLLVIGVICDYLAKVLLIKYRPSSTFANTHSSTSIYILVAFLLIGAGFIVRLRLEQLNNFSSLQLLRMALITGDLPNLQFPLSNIQSFSHALGLVILVFSIRTYRNFIPYDLKRLMIISFFISISIAMLEGNRASLIIILTQVFLILWLSRRLPDPRVIVITLFSTLLIFTILQMFMRQNESADDISIVFDLVIRNVASYFAGGLVAFDKVFSGNAAAPDFVLPISGFLSTIFKSNSNDVDVILPFLDLGGGTTGNVYTALYYFGFFHFPLLGLLIYSIATFVTSLFFRLARSSTFALLVASYLGVTFILWPLSEYFITLFPLFIRECLIYFFFKYFVFQRLLSRRLLFVHS